MLSSPSSSHLVFIMDTNPATEIFDTSSCEDETDETLHDNVSVSSIGQSIAEQSETVLGGSVGRAASSSPQADDNNTETESGQRPELISLERYRELKQPKSVAPSLMVRDGYSIGVWHRFSYWATETWLYEFLAWMLSLYCFGGIIVTFALHHDQPVPEWPFDITINALVSALSTVMGSALLVPLSGIIGQAKWSWVAKGHRKLADMVVYDEASRGPWGSLMLLLKKGFREPIALGAVITILALLIAPLLQQSTVVVLGHRSVENSTATLLALNWWAEGLRTPSGLPRVKDDMVLAINRGLFFDGNLSDPFISGSLRLRPQCQTGNCSFGVFESLAICSECRDISQFVTLQRSSDGSACGGAGTSEVQQTCARWGLPNGHDSGWLDVSSGMLMSTNASRDPILLRPGLSILNLTAMAPCWEVLDTLANKTRQYQVCNGKHEQTRTRAQECSLQWCAHKYKSEMTNGLLQEDIISTTHLGEYGPGFMYDFRPPNSSVSYYINLSPDRSDVNETNGIENITTGTTNGKLSVHRQASELVSEYLKPSWKAIRPKAIHGKSCKLSGETIAQNFDMSPLFEAMALSMTSSLRMLEARAQSISVHSVYPQDENGLGEDLSWDFPTIWSSINTAPDRLVPVLRVRWGWIALPAALEVAALLLLFYIVMWGSQRRLPVWKSSILPLLLLGSQMHNADNDDNLPRHIVDMEELAQEVSLEPETAMGRARPCNGNEPEEDWDLDETTRRENRDTNSDSDLTLC
ncbi:hypothetical protein PG984_003495 [Apiospora sp. TS-2023a]